MNSKRNEFKIKNRTIFTRDNIDVLRNMNSEVIDLIYLDPPFNSKRKYRAPIGEKLPDGTRKEEGFDDIWHLSDVSDEARQILTILNPDLNYLATTAGKAHGEGLEAYILLMSIRLLEMHRVLKPTGSIFVHCDPTASHYLKMVMDMVFGVPSFRNEIIWAYTGPSSPNIRQLPRKHDSIFWYSKGDTWTFNKEEVRVPYKDEKQGLRRGGAVGGEFTKEDVARYRERGKVLENWWTDITPVGRIKRELTRYPTQKPLALLERIIKMSSNKGELVLDPFCGCATTMMAAERLERHWIGIDKSPMAVKLLMDRMMDHYGEVRTDGQTRFLPWRPIPRTDKGMRTDKADIPNYRTHTNALYGEAGGNCAICGIHHHKDNMEVDHILPIDAGGTDHKQNLQIVCRGCHKSKSADERRLAVALRKGYVLPVRKQ